MVTLGAFLDGKLVCTITVRNKPRDIESAKRCLSDSYPEAQIFRKL
ncbi:hypothetical protein R75777_06981 [Paraburkholderia nemoris]|nr:hypothetical protein R75777_06981 [Paraburkholderia nemoris]